MPEDQGEDITVFGAERDAYAEFVETEAGWKLARVKGGEGYVR